MICAKEKILLRCKTFKFPNSKCWNYSLVHTFVWMYICSMVQYMRNKGGRDFQNKPAARGAIDTAMQFCCCTIPIFLTQASGFLVQSLYGQMLSSTKFFVICNEGRDQWACCQRVTCASNVVALLISRCGAPWLRVLTVKQYPGFTHAARLLEQRSCWVLCLDQQFTAVVATNQGRLLRWRRYFLSSLELVALHIAPTNPSIGHNTMTKTIASNVTKHISDIFGSLLDCSGTVVQTVMRTNVFSNNHVKFFMQSDWLFFFFWFCLLDCQQ